MRAIHRAGKWLGGVGFTLLVLVALTAVFIPAERQYYLNASLAGLLENLDRRTTYLSIADSAGADLVALIAKADKDEVRVEHIDRMADMLLSEDRVIREDVAIAVGWLGPSANRSSRVIPALRRAIAEEIAIGRSKSSIHTGPVDLLWKHQLSALSRISGVPFKDLYDHPEQFEQLPPIMDICRHENSAAYCDQLMAEWQAEHP